MNDQDTYGSSFREMMKRSMEFPAGYRQPQEAMPWFQRVILALVIVCMAVTIACEVARRIPR